jgi:hypothetical protein
MKSENTGKQMKNVWKMMPPNYEEKKLKSPFRWLRVAFGSILLATGEAERTLKRRGD